MHVVLLHLSSDKISIRYGSCSDCDDNIEVKRSIFWLKQSYDIRNLSSSTQNFPAVNIWQIPIVIVGAELVTGHKHRRHTNIPMQKSYPIEKCAPWTPIPESPAVRTNFLARVLCSIAAEEACFRMRVTHGVVLIRSLVIHVCVSECFRNGSGVHPYLLVQKKLV